MTIIKQSLIAAFVLASGIASSQGAIITWNFTDLNATVDQLDGTNVSGLAGVGAISIANSFGAVAAPISNTSPSSGYTGSSGTGNIGQAVNNATFGISTSPYFAVTLTPDSGSAVTVSGIDFGIRSTSTGATSFSLRSSVDNFAADIVTGTNTANSTYTLKTNSASTAVTGGTDVPVEVRLYVYGGASNAGSGTINTRLDDIKITATGFNATPVPEPTTAVSLLGGLGVLCGFRRIRDRRSAVRL